VAKADDIHITVKLGGKPLGEFVEQREVIACDDDESPQASAVDSGADVSAGTETLEDGLRRALREVLEREESLRDQLSDAQDHIGGLQQDVSDLLARNRETTNALNEAHARLRIIKATLMGEVHGA
jgi:chromosome segregation ATPase